MTSLQSLYAEAIFRLSALTWVELLDILLVMLGFYLLLRLIHRTRAAFLLRGVLVLSLILFVISVLLPLPAFDWLVQMTLFAILVATPIIFQPELRRLLERLGRSAGLAQAVRQTATEQVISQLVRSVENMSDGQTGALIVLEGNQTLQSIIETGVLINGSASSELLQAIFYPENPLHDGAAILREDKVVAAGCVLPLTQRLFNFQRRLGTRHRAAVGITEISDALVIVVSEETGAISVARNGWLQYQVDITTLREQLFDFYVPSTPKPQPPSLRELLRQAGRFIWAPSSRNDMRPLVSNIVLLFISLLLSLVVWSFVIQQTNPARQRLVEGINLRIENIPPNTTLVATPPATVSAIVQTTDEILSTLSANSFQATVSLEGIPPGLQRLPVQVNSGISPLRIISVSPSAVDLEVAPIISRTVPISVDIPDLQELSLSYRLVGTPSTSPAQVQVTGPAPLVERVHQVQTTVMVANANSPIREVRPLRAVDESGREISGINLDPAQAHVTVPIRQRSDIIEVGVRAVITGTPPAGYWVSGLNVVPASVTLRGNQDLLDQTGNFIRTLPVDVSQATGDLNVEVPLDLPQDVQAVDQNGNPIQTATILAQIDVRQGDLALTQPVELIGQSNNVTATVEPPEVDLLLQGPVPTLNQIRADPGLVRVVVNIADLNPDEQADVVPTIIAPDGIHAQLIPPSVLVQTSQ